MVVVIKLITVIVEFFTKVFSWFTKNRSKENVKKEELNKEVDRLLKDENDNKVSLINSIIQRVNGV